MKLIKYQKYFLRKEIYKLLKMMTTKVFYIVISENLKMLLLMMLLELVKRIYQLLKKL